LSIRAGPAIKGGGAGRPGAAGYVKLFGRHKGGYIRDGVFLGVFVG
jgi:hypothetical protein